MNTVIQGSAADLIKVAMVRVGAAMREAGFKSALVLQVHDELIWDAEPAEEKRLARLAVAIMGGAMEVQVPLVVDLKHGPNWEAMERFSVGDPRVDDARTAGG
jgi:DNA polymerase-1